MAESHAGELAGPTEGKNDGTDIGKDEVAAVEGAVKTFVAAFPHTVSRSDSLGLSKHLLKGHLEG